MATVKLFYTFTTIKKIKEPINQLFNNNGTMNVLHINKQKTYKK